MELTKRIARSWREFFNSEEGMLGLQWIMERRPPLDEKFWSQASGFEEFKKRIDEILSFERARASKDDEETGMK